MLPLFLTLVRVNVHMWFAVAATYAIAAAAFILPTPPTPRRAVAANTDVRAGRCATPRADLEPEGVRVNKALRATHSRRQADQLVADGRVRVNGAIVDAGTRLTRGDILSLDGAIVDWERLNPLEPSAEGEFVYLKMWKRRGVICTTDQRQPNNIIDALGPVPGVTDRIYPIGRLDADSTGLILLTSDGSIVNGLLRSSARKSKEYIVSTDTRATDAQIARLARGVTITTVAQRDGQAKPLTAPTKPCLVERIATGHDECRLRCVLQEGRNRQIRRMCEAIGLSVVRLHRVKFADVTLSGCRAAGDWCFLTDEEIDLCRSVAAPRESGLEQGAGDVTERVDWQRRPPLRRDAEVQRRYVDAVGRGSVGRGSTHEAGRGARARAAGSGQEQRMRSARITSSSARTTTTTWRRGAAAPVTGSDRSRGA